jgi:hypothetical protein
MRCTRIKKHDCMVTGNREHTHHYRLSFSYCLHLSVEDMPRLIFNFVILSIPIIILVLILLLLIARCSLKVGVVLPWIGALFREMTWLPTIKTWVVMALWSESTNARGIQLTWSKKSCCRSNVNLRPGLELWMKRRMIGRTKRRSRMVSRVINYPLTLVNNTRGSSWSILIFLGFLV